MRRAIPAELIRQGFCLPGALCDKSGRVLISAGIELTEKHISELGVRLITGLYAGDDWPDEMLTEPPDQQTTTTADACGASPQTRNSTASGTKDARLKTDDAKPANEDAEPAELPAGTDSGRVSVAVLRAGMRLAHSIYDPDGILLLAAGRQITPRFLYLLRQRDISVVQLQAAGEPPPGPRQEGDRSTALDRLLALEKQEQPAPIESSGPNERPRLPLHELWAQGRQALDRHLTTSALLTDVCKVVQDGGTVSGDSLRSLISDFEATLTLDCDLLATVVGMQETLGEYLFDHCVNVALLSMTIGAQLGMPREHILTIGMGAVFADTGMLRVPADIRLAPRTLTATERAEIERHPGYTLNYLERIQGLSKEVSFIGYQVHERTNGSGYPRKRSGTTTHPFAKIVAVADIYCAMTRLRPYRTAIVPHDAVKQLLRSGSQGELDRQILGAFLDSLSAFPIGSLVELNEGGIGKVVRANPGAHTRPVVAKVGPDGEPTGPVTDLLRASDIRVIRALPLAENASSAALGQTPATT